MIKQLSVFIENKEGRLKKAIDILSMANINIRALSIADTSKFGILRLIVQDLSKAKKILEENNFLVKETDVLAVEIPDEPTGLNKILNMLDKSKINLEYLYAFVGKKNNQAIVIIRVENIEEGLKALNNGNANILSQKDIETF
ncbi:MAG: amino acid-binding protein [Methanobrevibacter sp. CfCl-M3]